MILSNGTVSSGKRVREVVVTLHPLKMRLPPKQLGDAPETGQQVVDGSIAAIPLHQPAVLSQKPIQQVGSKSLHVTAAIASPKISKQ